MKIVSVDVAPFASHVLACPTCCAAVMRDDERAEALCVDGRELLTDLDRQLAAEPS